MEPCKISLGLLLIITLTLIPLSVAQDSPDDFVAAHNAVRQQVGVGPIAWDENVASYARNYSIQRVDCKLIHSGGPYGENIAWSSGPDFSVADAMNMWAGEEADYDYESNTCTPGKVCLHYTQIVWRNSVRLGCAKVPCTDGGAFITCNYYPPGNYIGQRPY